MALMDRITEIYNSIINASFNEVIISLIFALGFIVLGVVLGKIVSFGLKRASKKLELEKEIRPSFIGLIIAIIKWSIYIIFIDLALIQLPIEGITSVITRVLVVVPAIVAGLVIISIGFAIAVYLREVIEDSEITGWKMLSLYLFYFVLFVSGIYALKLALVSIDSQTANMILILVTGIAAAGVAYSLNKKHVQ